jgi:hypothetical protein
MGYNRVDRLSFIFDSTIGGRIKYAVLSDEAIFRNYSGEDTDIVTPDALCGKPMTRMGFLSFFADADSIVTSLALPASVRHIACHALKNDRLTLTFSAMDVVNINKTIETRRDVLAFISLEGSTAHPYTLQNGRALVPLMP